MRHKRLLLLALSPILFACAGTRHAPAPEGEVQVDGTLRGMIHEGKTGPVVKLEGLLPDPALYAVGALAGMAGEVTIVAGKPYLSYGQGSDARVETSETTAAAAALLVRARVPSWKTVTTTQTIGFDKLDEEIGKLAASAGLDLGTRIPFVIEGRVRTLEWHVLNGPPAAGAEADHDAHLKNAVQLRLPSTSATLVGFYSEKDEGVFTHMGSKTHIHCVVGDPPSAGHVDHVIVLPGATVKFPL